MLSSSFNSEYFEQYQYILKLQPIIKELYGEKPLALVATYGCQQNVSDSEKLKGMLNSIGFSFTNDENKADFIIFNTCAVREHAEDRVFGNIGALKNQKRRKPNLCVAMCGCMAQRPQVAERIKKSFPFVNILFGTHVIHKLPEFMFRYFINKKRVFDISTDNTTIVEDIPIKRDATYKGWLPIMYGCNNFCSYCIVPYPRGRERSRAVDKVLEDAKNLINSGCKDITLLGQNVNSYNYNGINFPKLLKKINALDGDFRIRFMTSHPKDCTEELLYAINDCEKVCKHLHLPFQSGSSRILKLMNRKYTKEQYLELIKKAKQIIKGLTLTSDIIVGFPGETYEDFKETLSLVKEVRFMSLFTFIFSKREGTPAANMLDNISPAEKSKWFSELLQVQANIAKEDSKKLINKEFRVLCDEIGRKSGFMAGHTDTNYCFEFPGTKEMLGKFINIITYENNGEILAKIKE